MVAILGIVAALAVPEIKRAQVRAKATSEGENLRMIEAAKAQFSRAYPGKQISAEADLFPYLPNNRLPKSPWGVIYANVLDMHTTVTSPANGDATKEPAVEPLMSNGFNDIIAADRVYYKRPGVDVWGEPTGVPTGVGTGITSGCQPTSNDVCDPAAGNKPEDEKKEWLYIAYQKKRQMMKQTREEDCDDPSGYTPWSTPEKSTVVATQEALDTAMDENGDLVQITEGEGDIKGDKIREDTTDFPSGSTSVQEARDGIKDKGDDTEWELWEAKEKMRWKKTWNLEKSNVTNIETTGVWPCVTTTTTYGTCEWVAEEESYSPIIVDIFATGDVLCDDN